MERLLVILFLSFPLNMGVIAQSVIVNPDGTHSTVHGNVIVNPDGTHSTVHGNVIVNPDGTHTIVNNSIWNKSSKDNKKRVSSFAWDSYNNGTYTRKAFPVRQYNKATLSNRSIVFDIPFSFVFNNTIDYLQDNGYFIRSLDKQSGFIQARIYLESKKLFSAKDGERRTLNFIIRPSKEHKTIARLTIYLEDRNFGGDNLSRTYYYEDKGICNDESVYQEVSQGLQDYLSEE